MVWTEDIDEFIRDNHFKMGAGDLANILQELTGKYINGKMIFFRQLELGLIPPPEQYIGGIRIGDNILKYVINRLVIDGKSLYIGTLLEKPHQTLVGEIFLRVTARCRNAYKRAEFKKGADVVTPEIAAAIRKGYKEVGYKQLMIRFGLSRGIIYKVIKNEILPDQEYTYIKRKFTQQAVLVEILGETKTIHEWSNDKRCKVSEAQLYRRYNSGMRGADLLHYGGGITATMDGETKTQYYNINTVKIIALK